MNVHFDDDSSMSGRARRPRSLPWSLLLLGIGYFALVAGPLLTSRIAALRWVQDLATGRAWLPAPAATGMALLGATALIFVIARLVRDVEQRPYGAIAPVLAVFSGFVLTSMRTQLPLPGVGAAELGILVLTLGVLGGAMIGRDSWGERALGWVLALVPPIAVMSALTAVLGHANPLTMLTGAEPALRMYVLMLGASSLCLGLVGAVGRSLAQRPSELFPYGEPGLRLPRMDTSPGFGGPMRTRTLPGVYGSQSRDGMRSTGPGSSNMGFSRPVMSDDPDLLLLTRPKRPLVRMLIVGGLIAAGVAGGAYYFPSMGTLQNVDFPAMLRNIKLPSLLPASLTPATPAAKTTSSASARAATPVGSTTSVAPLAVESATQRAVPPSVSAPTTAAPTTSAAPVVTPIARSATASAPPVTATLPPVTAAVPRVTATVPPVTAAVPPVTASVPPVTASVPPVAQQKPSRAVADAPSTHVHRSHHSRHHRREEARASESSSSKAGAKPAAAAGRSERSEPKATSKVSEPAQPKATSKGAEPAQPKETAKAAPAPSEQKEGARTKPSKSQPSEDLDLDMLVKKALKSSNGVSAQEDPILGL